MNITFAFFLCTASLLAAGVQGMVTARKGRCMCQSKSPQPVRMILLANLETHPRSSSCNQVEIIATLKQSGERRCLDPESKEVQKFMENYKKIRSLWMQKERRQRVLH
ncbi:C-X-C motif chemokine 10-like [Elgaria multicarinata webbii]|uniref:C-X-C motif chemokine 10-like n=1 Tax=Elgaria multicarinata webbii TaxID=159646 RepID=UPI002FCD6617